jgi:hypothetical protein
MSDTPKPERRLVLTAAVLVAAIACDAFVISYSALYSLALAANIVHPLAVIYPFLVDGFIVVASLAAVAMRGQSRRNTWYPWMLLVLFFSFSVLGNAVHANARHGVPHLPPVAAAAVSAVPPIALGLAFHLLVRMVAPDRPEARLEPVASETTDHDVHAAARELIDNASRNGSRLTGATLARALGISDRHGRRLLADLGQRESATSAAASDWPA